MSLYGYDMFRQVKNRVLNIPARVFHVFVLATATNKVLKAFSLHCCKRIGHNSSFKVQTDTETVAPVFHVYILP